MNLRLTWERSLTIPLFTSRKNNNPALSEAPVCFSSKFRQRCFVQEFKQHVLSSLAAAVSKQEKQGLILTYCDNLPIDS
jgi:hypothetical protein